MNKEIEELKKEIEKTFNFHRSHNIMTNKPKGVMAVSEAEKLVNKFIKQAEKDQKEVLNKIAELKTKHFGEELKKGVLKE